MLQGRAARRVWDEGFVAVTVLAATRGERGARFPPAVAAATGF